MKIKLDFVTNSSSCSFTILKKYITESQRAMIHNHIEIGFLLLSEDDKINQYVFSKHDKWRISETKDSISGDTSMDNFDMDWFLKEIGIDRNRIKREHSNDGYY